MLRLTQDMRPGRRSKLGAIIGTVGLTLALSVSSAFAATGNNGTVKVHDSDTPPERVNNEPHVCEFYLAFYFSDPAEAGDWEIVAWDGSGSVVESGTYLTDSDGFYRTDDMTLDDGHYRVNWQGINDTSWKHKMFWVDCLAGGGGGNGGNGGGGGAGGGGGGGGAGGGGGESGVQAGQGGPGGPVLPDAAMEPPETSGGLVALGLLLMTAAAAAIHRLRTETA
jgi:uncharacterized membrane protein YgcG